MSVEEQISSRHDGNPKTRTSLFAATLSKPLAERASFLDGACYGDPVLALAPDAHIPAHFMNLLYPRHISRFNWRLSRLNIYNSVAVTRDAYRPFFSTDAAVADKGTSEVELVILDLPQASHISGGPSRSSSSTICIAEIIRASGAN
jgi:hypothetical protein